MVQSIQFQSSTLNRSPALLNLIDNRLPLRIHAVVVFCVIFSCGKLSRKLKNSTYNLFIFLFSADHLSMETLLSMTSKRAGEWFKEELRELGGLDHLVRTSSDCLNFLVADEISMWTEPLHNKLRKTGRVLKVLESVSFFLMYFF